MLVLTISWRLIKLTNYIWKDVLSGLKNVLGCFEAEQKCIFDQVERLNMKFDGGETPKCEKGKSKTTSYTPPHLLLHFPFVGSSS